MGNGTRALAKPELLDTDSTAQVMPLGPGTQPQHAPAQRPNGTGKGWGSSRETFE